MNKKTTPTEKQLTEWIQEAHKSASSNTVYTTSTPVSIQRALAQIAYRAGIKRGSNVSNQVLQALKAARSEIQRSLDVKEVEASEMSRWPEIIKLSGVITLIEGDKNKKHKWLFYVPQERIWLEYQRELTEEEVLKEPALIGLKLVRLVTTKNNADLLRKVLVTGRLLWRTSILAAQPGGLRWSI